MRKAVMVDSVNLNIQGSDYPVDKDLSFSWLKAEDGKEYTFDPELTSDELLDEYCRPGSLVVLEQTGRYAPEIGPNPKLDYAEDFRIWTLVLPEDGEVQADQN